MKILRVQPGLREEVVLVWELLLETLQVDRQSVLARDVVHAKEVIDSLVRLQRRQKVRRDAKVLPTDLPIELLGVGRDKLLELGEEFFVLEDELLWDALLCQAVQGVLGA